jgi:nucleoside-diphosphate kinase
VNISIYKTCTYYCYAGAMVWEGANAVKEGRKMLGATMPSESACGTIRGDFCIEVGRNVCHGSDAVESAEKEIALWFPPLTNIVKEDKTLL